MLMTFMFSLHVNVSVERRARLKSSWKNIEKKQINKQKIQNKMKEIK